MTASISQLQHYYSTLLYLAWVVKCISVCLRGKMFVWLSQEMLYTAPGLIVFKTKHVDMLLLGLHGCSRALDARVCVDFIQLFISCQDKKKIFQTGPGVRPLSKVRVLRVQSSSHGFMQNLRCLLFHFLFSLVL